METEVTELKDQVAELEATTRMCVYLKQLLYCTGRRALVNNVFCFPDARALLNTSQQCTSGREGVLLFSSGIRQLKVCSNQQWIGSYEPPPKGSSANVAYSCSDVAASPKNTANGRYYVYVSWTPAHVRYSEM